MSLKLKRNLGLPLLLATLAFALILGMGDQRIYAYTVHGSRPLGGTDRQPRQRGCPADRRDGRRHRRPCTDGTNTRPPEREWR